jgi:hypothetical protein
LGISKDQASRWQTMAQNPKAVERYLRETDDVPTAARAPQAAAESTTDFPMADPNPGAEPPQ